jgi:hypothetical protein
MEAVEKARIIMRAINAIEYTPGVRTNVDQCLYVVWVAVDDDLGCIDVPPAQTTPVTYPAALNFANSCPNAWTDLYGLDLMEDCRMYVQILQVTDIDGHDIAPVKVWEKIIDARIVEKNHCPIYGVEKSNE